MGGGLLQLVAYGAQDAYLSGNPQITFWRGLYKRHTNFAMEPFRVNLTGQANWGVKHSAILPRHADLVSHAYLEVELPAYGLLDEGNNYGWAADFLGYKMIKYVELDIGGQVIDRLYGEWLYIWSTLTNDLTTYFKNLSLVSIFDTNITTDSQGCESKKATKFYIPLSFYFTRNPGAALPLIALQYHEVKFNIVWNTSEFLTRNTGEVNGLEDKQPPAPPPPKQANLLIDYVYLDVEERRRMAQESHEYLIEQVQFNEDKGITSQNTRVDLTFNHPVKELVWVLQQTGFSQCKYPYLEDPTDPETLVPAPHAVGDTVFRYDTGASVEYGIQINGQDRVPLLDDKYFGEVQPYQHHTGGGASLGGLIGGGESSSLATGINCYSFAIRPEEHQPSGTCNFSRIDTATLLVKFPVPIDFGQADLTFDCRVYAVNYNVLRIMSGMGGLAYSN